MSQVYAGDRAFSPKLASVMVRVAQLHPAVGHPSPRTMKCRGLEKSKASQKVGRELMYSARLCSGQWSPTVRGGPSRYSTWPKVSARAKVAQASVNAAREQMGLLSGPKGEPALNSRMRAEK